MSEDLESVIYEYDNYTLLSLIHRTKGYIPCCEICGKTKNSFLRCIGDGSFGVCIDCLQIKIDRFKIALEQRGKK